MHQNGHVAELLFTFGLAFVIEEVVQMIWGKAPVDYRVPPSLDFPAFTMFSTNYPAYKMFMLLTAVAIFAVLLVVLKSTRIGLIIQAALTHPTWSAMLGHNVPTRVHAGVRRRHRACRGRRRDRRPGAGDAVEHGGGCWARSCSSSSWSAGWARWPARSSPRC